METLRKAKVGNWKQVLQPMHLHSRHLQQGSVSLNVCACNMCLMKLNVTFCCCVCIRPTALTWTAPCELESPQLAQLST